MAGVAGEKDRGLAGGVAAADEGDVFVAAQPGLDGRGPVGNAAALELREVGNLRAAVAGSGGDDDGARADAAAVAELEDVDGVRAGPFRGAVQAHDLGRQAELGAELHGLRDTHAP